MADIMFDDM